MPNDSPDWTTNIARPQTEYGSSPYAYTSAGLNISVSLTPDVHVVGLAFLDNSSLQTLTVVGNVTGTTYLSLRPTLSTPGPIQWVPVMSAVDTSVEVEITATASGSVWIVLMGESSGVIAYPANGTMNVQITAEPFNLTTDQKTATSNPWLHPKKYLYVNTGNLVSAGSFTMIPGVAGLSIYMHAMCLTTLDGGTVLDIYDGTSAGTVFDAFVQETTGTPTNAYQQTQHPHLYQGVQLTSGNALTAVNASGATHSWIGYITYTQA